MSGEVGGLLLAAGEGRRLGLPKGLIELGGEALVERGARTLAEAGCDPVVVVVGARGDEVRACLRTPATVVDNPDWASGMGSSLRAGLAAMPSQVRATAIVLVDQPGVSAAAVERVIAAWRRGARAAVATYQGRHRNPVALDRSLWQEAASSAVGDTGARALLRARPWLVTPVPCEDVAEPSDLDVPEDLEAARAAARSPDRGGSMDPSEAGRPASRPPSGDSPPAQAAPEAPPAFARMGVDDVDEHWTDGPFHRSLVRRVAPVGGGVVVLLLLVVALRRRAFRRPPSRARPRGRRVQRGSRR